MFSGLRERLRTGGNVAEQSTREISAEEDRYGLFSLVDESSEALGYDIVAVHGLGGSYDKTWTADNGSFWVKDFLPVDVAQARIFSYGYDSSTFFSRGVTRIEDEALILLNRIHGVRSTPEQRAKPICFIGHSLGGIIIKKTLILAHENAGRYGNLLQHVKAVVFFGVPHRGADISFWGHFAANITKVAQLGLNTNARFVKDLETDSSVLTDISTQFIHRAAELKQVYTFFETARLNGILIVDRKSARLNMPNEVPDAINDADHRSICKFQRLESQSYTAVRQCFQELQRELQITSTNEEDQDTTKVATLQALHQTLAFPSMDDRYHAIDSPVAGTCEWLLRENGFQVWRDSKSNEPLSDRMLWLKAKPGAGKSTLMKAMYDNSRQQASSYTLCYFFNARSTVKGLDNSFCGMLRSLLWRLLTYDISLLSVTPDFRDPKRQNRTVAESWHLNEIKDLFSRCLRKVKGRYVHLYIDALDECPEDQARAAIRFFEALAEHIDVVRFLFSSRFCPFISHEGREIEMEPHTAPDIWRYITTYLPHTVDGQSSQSLGSLIGTRSSGIFLWTVFTVDEVRRANDRSFTYRQIQDLVEKIPLGLESMIEDVVRRIDPVHRSKACLIFNWVLLASDALDPLEVFAMTRFDPQNPAANDASRWPADFDTMKRAIRTFSGGLLEIKAIGGFHGQHSYVQFIHESVRDHLQTSKFLKNLLTGSGPFELIPNHTPLADFCADYIGQVPGFSDRRLDSIEMAKLLGIHADVFRLMCASAPVSVHDSAEGMGVEKFFDVAKDHGTFVKDDSNVDRNVEHCDRLSEYLANETWIADFRYTNWKGGVLESALEFPSKYKNLRKSVELLAPVQRYESHRSKYRQAHFLKGWHYDEMRSMYRRLKTPFPLLLRTIEEFFLHLKFVQEDTVVERRIAFLVEENSFLRVNFLDAMICVGNFLDLKTLSLHPTRINRVPKIDYPRYYDCASNERTRPYWQVQALVRLAVGYDIPGFLGKLLAVSPHVWDVADSVGRSPLDHALNSGCVGTSALLLQNGATIDMNRNRGRTATSIMRNGTRFAETLISGLVESTDVTKIFGGLLESSIYASEPDLIECLSKGGADLNIKFNDGHNALIQAARLENKNSEKLVDALLRHGATPRCTDHLGRTALHYASTRSDCKVTHILLESKAEVNAVDQTGQTPLDFALTFRNYDVAILLQSYGAISLASAEAVRTPKDDHPPTSKSSDEWVIDSDECSAPWESDSADENEHS